MPAAGVPAVLDAGLPAPAHGRFTTRAHGASTGAWAAGNLALHVQDDTRAVQANRAGLCAALGLPVTALVFAEQVHGNGVATVRGAPGDGVADGPARPGPAAVPGVDALVTGTPGTVLVMMAADCLPVLLADPVAGVVAAAHAGRQGLLAGVLQQTLRGMAHLGAHPGRTTAVLGPAICGRCYELPADLADEVGAAVPGSRAVTARGTPGVDLAAGAERLLTGAGVAVRREGGCTLEQPGRFYSYRRDGVTGRHAGVVWLAA